MDYRPPCDSRVVESGIRGAVCKLGISSRSFERCTPLLSIGAVGVPPRRPRTDPFVDSAGSDWLLLLVRLMA